MIKPGSSLLRFSNQSVKLSKNGHKPNWIHHPQVLQGGHVVYLVKFLGNTEVDQPKGIEVVKEGIRKMKFNQHLKRAEGTKTPKVELTISIDGVAIQDPKTKKISYQYPLHRISYCADDKTDPKFFSFIAKEADSDRHNCFVFVSDKLAEEITLTIGQAFDLAYRRFLDTSGRDLEMRKQFMMLHKRVQELEAENKQLRCRLSVYENSSKSRSSSTTRLPSSSSHQTAGRNQNSASNGVGQPPKLQPIQPPPQSRSRNSSSSQSVNLLNIDLLDDQPTVGRKLENLNLEDASLFSLNSSSSYMQPVTNNNNLINSNLNNNNNNNNNNTNSASSLIDSNHSSYISISNGFKNGHSNGSTHNGTGTTDIFGFAPFNPANSNEKTAEDPFGMDPFNNKLGTFQAKELEQAIGDIDKKLAEMRDGFSRGISFGNADFNSQTLASSANNN